MIDSSNTLLKSFSWAAISGLKQKETVMVTELSRTIHRMDKRAIDAMQSFSDSEVNSQDIAYRKLCALNPTRRCGYHSDDGQSGL